MPNAILGGDGGLHHVCIKTRDWPRTVAFYRDTLGCTEAVTWNLRDTGCRAVMLDTGDRSYIEVFEVPDYAGPTDGAIAHLALRTTRLDEVAARVRAAGMKITVEPKDVTLASTNGRGALAIRIFFCEGPNGEMIEFFQNEAT
jgi:glyoxylase I family protein